MLRDMAILTGGQVIAEELGLELENVSKVRVSEEAAKQVRLPLKRSHATQYHFSKLFAIPDRMLPNPMVLQVVPDVFSSGFRPGA